MDASSMKYVRNKSLSTLPPFLLKTYMLVEDPATDEVISWNDDGTAFVVWQLDDFSRDLLPTLFKHCNFSSFVRQLNTYGFRKSGTGRWEFCNDNFRRGERELLCEIRRRKARGNDKRRQRMWENPPLRSPTPQQMGPPSGEYGKSSQSASSASEHRNLVQENKCLKRENGALNAELKSMKQKYMKLTELVAQYTHQDAGKQQEEGPKLLGVRLWGAPGNGSMSLSTSSSSSTTWNINGEGRRETGHLPCSNMPVLLQSKV
ncbi:hypothetical protein MLD38_031022 [Melastoma candidum]|uniref:Uncharacterized protein n=1 Tax=Melastoma candidum TaxID=119954 RepID=A0ACB9MTF1_9MYRT|nr:hypothetical protein MLD38_031022 [Melastoma candidum]